MHARLIVSLAALLVAAPLAIGPALSAGGGGGGGGNGGGSGGGGAQVPVCKKGLVWDKSKRRCVVPRQGAIDDDSIYETGRSLAMNGRYDDAIKILTLATDKTDPRILNYLGYSHRKAGRVLVGLGYYREALHYNPDYTLVREYLGEAHLQMGDVTAAKVQLDEIRKRCGTTCSEYTQLSSQIDTYTNGS
jgi:tetratricopeptide (TPR) repeat protein